LGSCVLEPHWNVANPFRELESEGRKNSVGCFHFGAAPEAAWDTGVAGTNFFAFSVDSLDNITSPQLLFISRPLAVTSMWRVDTEEKKLALREAVLWRRNALTREGCLLSSRAIQARALQLPAYQASRSVGLYSAIQNEVRTDEILDHALTSGRRVFYPRTAQKGAGEFISVTSGVDLCAGRYGIREPSGVEPLSDNDFLALTIFVPGVAFDRSGSRLGRGKGWYDRMLGPLEDKATLVALAYQFQLVEEVPSNLWDRKVHYIVTENEVIHCDAAGVAARPVSQ
jgi:5-formyltetrahydrofolate cyclo-ligase